MLTFWKSPRKEEAGRVTIWAESAGCEAESLRPPGWDKPAVMASDPWLEAGSPGEGPGTYVFPEDKGQDGRRELRQEDDQDEQEELQREGEAREP